MEGLSSPALRRVPSPPFRAERVAVEANGRHYLGYIGNLSETGAFVQCSNPKPEGSVIDILLYLPNSSEGPLLARAEVRWTRGYGGRSGPTPGMGVQFLDLGQRQRARLRQYCCQPPIATGPSLPPTSTAA